jgi:hypothetical protein
MDSQINILETKDDFLKEHYELYKKELQNFTYITHSNLEMMKKGGTIKYIDLNGKLLYGGFLINSLNNELYTTMKLLLKVSNNYYTISYSKNYIFYSDPIKKPRKPKPSIKVVFTELLDELNKI